MTSRQADLQAYYEEEARQRARTPLQGARVELRTACIELLLREARTSVVDFGAGPGFDGPDFVTAGIDYVGIDLAHGNGVLASEAGLTVLQASAIAPPFRPRSFDAGWSMSTVMHLADDEIAAGLAAMSAVLRDEAPLFLGQWGSVEGQAQDLVDDAKISGQRRVFHLRSYAENRRLAAALGRIEQEQVWPVGPPEQEYQLFVVRVRAE